MIEFLNPALFGGLAVASAPVIIHLLHRRNVKPVDWGAMRFLMEMMAQSRRRLWLNEILLLLVRALLITCVAMAMMRPAFHPNAESNGVHGIVRQGRAAAVLLIDDSLSTAAGRAQPAFESMKKLGIAYLDSLAPGDEVSVLLMSQLGGAASDPWFDLESLKATLGHLKPSAVATDIPALLDAGLDQLKRHINPGAELVILTDGRKDGWRETDKVRWDELRERLRGPKNAAVGTRQRPQIILLAPAVAVMDDNVAITSLAMDRTMVCAGKPAGIRVMVANYGQRANREATVQVSVDGQVVGSRRVELPVGGQQEVVFEHAFEPAGSHGIEAALVDNQDLLSGDDRRFLSVQVESSLPVLLVEGEGASGLGAKLGFLSVALEPDSGNPSAFRVTRIPVTEFSSSMLKDYRVVVLGDVRMLEPATIDALERFVVSGGGVLVGLGPGANVELINRYWARNGEGFLPCPLDKLMTPSRPAIPAMSNPGHPVFSGFGSRTDEAWKNAKVKSYFKLDTQKAKAAELDVLLKLDTGDALVVERRRGLGLVAMVTTSLNADWSDLPLQAAYVPLLRGVVGHLGSFIMPSRNLRPGEPMIYARVKAPVTLMQGEDLHGKPLKLEVGSWEGRDAIVSDPLMEPGIYVLNDPKENLPIRFAVSPDPAESALIPLTDREMLQAFDRGASVFHNPETVAENLDPARRQSVELWKWLVLGAVGLMFLEAWMTRREAVSGVATTG